MSDMVSQQELDGLKELSKQLAGALGVIRGGIAAAEHDCDVASVREVLLVGAREADAAVASLARQVDALGAQQEIPGASEPIAPPTVPEAWAGRKRGGA